jgi:hypothetical protein
VNLYFLVEGRRSELRIYPSWLTELLPGWERVLRPSALTNSTYYLISGEGYPSLLGNHLRNAVLDINDASNVDFLVVVLDTDGCEPEARSDEVRDALDALDVALQGCNLVVIPQHSCIETWLLGNRRIVTRAPARERLRDYLNFFDVRAEDPEAMDRHGDFQTVGQFHFAFVQEVFREKGIAYTKRNPGHAADPAYLRALRERVGDERHLSSLRRLIEFCEASDQL